MVQFRGREITHPETGRKILEKVIRTLADVTLILQMAQMEGNRMNMVLGPKPKRDMPKAAAPKAAAPVVVLAPRPVAPAAAAASSTIRPDSTTSSTTRTPRSNHSRGALRPTSGADRVAIGRRPERLHDVS